MSAFRRRVLKGEFDVYGARNELLMLFRLVGIAKSERLSKHVVSLEIGDEILPVTPVPPKRFAEVVRQGFQAESEDLEITVIDFHKHFNVVKDDFPEQLTTSRGTTFTREELFGLYIYYRDDVIEHRKLREDGLNVLYLSSAMTQFSKLSAIVLSESKPTLTQQKKSWGAINLAQGTFWSDVENSYPTHSWTFCEAVAATSRVISSLTLKQRDDEYSILDDEFDGKMFELALPMMAGLTYLHMIIPSWAYNYSDSIIGLLQETPNLQCLKLDANESDTDDEWFYTGAMCDYVTSTNIVELELTNCCFKFERIKNFLAKQSKSLKTCSMQRNSLADGTWEQLFKIMRDQLSITEIHIKQSLMEGSDHSLRDYEWDGQHSPQEDLERRDLARRGIEKYVVRISEHLPVDLFDNEDMPEDGLKLVIRDDFMSRDA